MSSRLLTMAPNRQMSHRRQSGVRFPYRPQKCGGNRTNRRVGRVGKNHPIPVQRPVFKDFSLTKKPTADSKSQASPSVFFNPWRDWFPFETVKDASIGNESGVFNIDSLRLTIDAKTGAGILSLIGNGFKSETITQRLTETP